MNRSIALNALRNRLLRQNSSPRAISTPTAISTLLLRIKTKSDFTG